jgi:hypothetical protein
VRRLAGGEQPVGSFFLPTAGKKRLARMNDIKSSSRSPIKARETGALP